MGEISKLQLLILVVSSVIANGILAIPQAAAGIGGPGGWIVVLLIGLYATLQVILLTLLLQRFPNTNFIDININVLGKFAGSLAAGILVFYFALTASLVTRGITNVALTTVLPSTPPLVIMSILVLTSIYAVYFGLEILARVNLILFALKTVTFLSVIFFTIPQMELENLLPLWEKGSMSVTEGILSIHSAFTGYIILAYAYPYLRNKKGALFTAAFALLVITVIYLIAVVISTAVFGPSELVRMNWPVFFLIRQVPVPVDAPFMAVWVTNAFSVISSTIFMLCYTLKELFKLKDYRYLLPPLAVIIISISSLPQNIQETGSFAVNLAYIGTIFEWLMPAVLLGLTVILKKGTAQST
ncbi:MAG: endospore germination permease [Desulfotomaculum sp.]|nr:endospore germination permease [Desulfotomaculum sp.]